MWNVKRLMIDDWVSKCRNLEVVGGIRKGRGRKTWIEGVTTDMKKFGLKTKMRRIGRYGVVQLLVTSNPCFSVEKWT